MGCKGELRVEISGVGTLCVVPFLCSTLLGVLTISRSENVHVLNEKRRTKTEYVGEGLAPPVFADIDPCHCEPVTDVTGVAIRSPLQRLKSQSDAGGCGLPRQCAYLPRNDISFDAQQRVEFSYAPLSTLHASLFTLSIHQSQQPCRLRLRLRGRPFHAHGALFRVRPDAHVPAAV